MKKIVAAAMVVLASLAGAVLLPGLAHAAYDPFNQPNNQYNVCATGGGASSVCKAGTQNPIVGPNGAIVKATNILSTVAGIIAVIFVVWGGIKYITSGGDAAGVSTAKNTIIAALIGALLALLARPIVNFVISRI